MKTHLAAALGSVVLTIGALLGAPAAGAQPAAHPTTPVTVTEEGGHLRGTVTWYNRSVGFSGTLRAVGCHRVSFGAYGASGHEFGTWSTGTKCDVTYPFNVVISPDAPGSIAYVRICLDDVNANSSTCIKYDRP